MNLYEALKAGISKKELLDSFQKDLDAATEQIENEEYLDACRFDLAYAMLEYSKALLKENFDISNTVEVYEKYLLDFEKSFSKRLFSSSDSKNNNKNFDTRDKQRDYNFKNDEAIIRNFIKNL